MSFQNISFKHNGSGTDSRIHGFVTQKLSVLEKYVDNTDPVKIEVEFEKVAPHNSGDICRVEINLSVGGTLYRAERTHSTFESAIDLAKDELDQEMRRAHKKRHSMFRKGARKIKDMVRFGG